MPNVVATKNISASVTSLTITESSYTVVQRRCDCAASCWSGSPADAERRRGRKAPVKVEETIAVAAAGPEASKVRRRRGRRSSEAVAGGGGDAIAAAGA